MMKKNETAEEYSNNKKAATIIYMIQLLSSSRLMILAYALISCQSPSNWYSTAVDVQAKDYDFLLYERYFDGGEHKCDALFGNLMEPVNSDMLIENPPVVIPLAFFDMYTFHNIIPHQTFYFDNGHGNYSSFWTVDLIDIYIENKIGCYNMIVCDQALSKYPQIISGKMGLVIGSETPWAEAMLINKNASHITTVEYANVVSEHPQISVIKPNDWAASVLLKPHVPMFDFCFTFSSIEHDGLGRYGDPINPFADFETIRRIHCQLKDGGILFLGIPCGPDTIRWNGDRVYGLMRLSILLKGWTIVDVLGDNEPLIGEAHAEQEKHIIWVLQKTDRSCSGDTCAAADNESSYLEAYFHRMENPRGGELVENSKSLLTAYRLYEVPILDGLQPFIFMGRHVESVGLLSDLCAKKCLNESIRRAFPADCEASLCLLALRHYYHSLIADGDDRQPGLEPGADRNVSQLWRSFDHFILRLSLPDSAVQHHIRDIVIDFQDQVTLTVTRGDAITVAVILQRCERFCLHFMIIMPGCTLVICRHVVMYVCCICKYVQILLLLSVQI